MKIEDIRRVLIIGGGTMGQQIGLLCAFSGYDTVIYDTMKETVETAPARIAKKAKTMVAMNKYPQEAVEPALARIIVTDNAEEAAKDVDLISESVPEDPELKGKVFARFNKLCKPETIFTTNTSSLVPSQFAQATGRPEKLCALHFHDVAISNIVDVMPHPGTSEETVQVVKAFAEKIDQVAIVLNKEHNGYVFNNMLMAVLGSALGLASGGVASVEDIDRSWMGVLHTFMGPFGIMDSIGLETVWKVTDYWANARNDSNAKRNAEFLKKYVDAGKIGLKTNEGFYTYPSPAYADKNFLTSGK